MQINRRDLQLENMRILTNLCVWMSPREKHHFCCKSNSRYQPASNSPYITKLSIQKKIKFRKRKSFTNFLEHSVLFPWAENTLITLKDRNTSLELDWGNRKFCEGIYMQRTEKTRCVARYIFKENSKDYYEEHLAIFFLPLHSQIFSQWE